MSDEQQQLPIKARRSGPRIEANDPRIEKMILKLRNRGWIKRRALCLELGWDDRVMRAVKAAAGGRIISCTERGYCLAEEADRKSFSVAISQARSRLRQEAANVRNMLREFRKIERSA
ncbi:MAG: hypothetical protein WA117_11690 [Verrucomicrobiia bacterium]